MLIVVVLESAEHGPEPPLMWVDQLCGPFFMVKTRVSPLLGNGSFHECDVFHSLRLIVKVHGSWHGTCNGSRFQFRDTHLPHSDMVSSRPPIFIIFHIANLIDFVSFSLQLKA